MQLNNKGLYRIIPFVNLLLCANIFTAHQLSLSRSYSESSLSYEELIKQMHAAATPEGGGKGFEPLLIQVPGEQRFYKRVYLRDGITGLLSAASKIDVEVMALQITIDPKEDARAMVLKLKKIYKVALAEKKLERLCDILLPDELGQYVTDLAPCTHENDECKSYWYSVKDKLEQQVAKSTTNHFGMILVPYQQ